MADFQGEVVRNSQGREVVRFTTASGVRAVVATCIPQEALDKVARSLKRKLTSSQTSQVGATRQVPTED
jgi:nitrate/TMAO reductase-like tetraheme cytochrome c subunit